MVEEKKYPEGHFISMYMAIFMPLGIPLAFAFGGAKFIGIGLSIGMSLGLAVGYGVENKYKKEGKIRLLTEKEKRIQKRWMIIGFIILAIALTIFLLLLIR